MQTQAPTLTLTDTEAGEVVFVKGMIEDFYPNPDGTTTIVTKQMGKRTVKEDSDYVEKGLKSLT